MISTIISILIFLAVLGVLVFIHELGHFLAARAIGAKVEEFAIGLGWKVYSKKYKGTEYKINLLPIGGYVKILGENDKEKTDDPKSLRNKTPIQRIFVMIAGVVMNFILAAIVYYIIFFSIGYKFVLPDTYADFKPYIGEMRIEKLSDKIEYDELTKDLGAIKSGMPEKGEIVSINSIELEYSNEISKILSANKDKTVDVNVCSTECKTYKVMVNNEGRIGISLTPNYVYALSYENDKALAGVGHSMNMLKLMLSTLSDIFSRAKQSGNYNEVANTVSGPVGIYLAIDTVKQYGIISVIGLAADMSLVLAFMNLLPIPALDGGRIVLTVPELITGKPLNPKLELILINVSFLLLLLLMFVIFVKDIVYFDALKEMFK
jgi:regulator of sigma E protease